MFYLATTETTNIIQMIPPAYLVAFAGIMAVVLFVANRLLTKLFIPKEGQDEAPVWAWYGDREK
ncbi:MAG: hypothetical protein IKU54_04145 [Oscillospiraceae bacterium]|nr:hypothetical protein [Oscillospiraceae bacterium]